MYNLKLIAAAATLVAGLGLIAPANAATLREGTPIELRFISTLSSGTSTTGEKFELEVASDVLDGETVVVPAGSKAVGSVVSAKKKGFAGKQGELNVDLNYVLINGKRIPIRASQGAEGDGRLGTAVALTVLFGPIGLLKRGLDVTIPAGKPITAYVDTTTEI